MNRLALLVAASLISSSARAAVLEVADDTPTNADVAPVQPLGPARRGIELKEIFWGGRYGQLEHRPVAFQDGVPLEGTALYEALDKPELARVYEERRGLRVLMLTVGFVGLLAGPVIAAENNPRSVCDDVPPSATFPLPTTQCRTDWNKGRIAIGVGTTLLGFAGFGAAAAIHVDPLDAEGLRRAVDEHNARLGAPPANGSNAEAGNQFHAALSPVLFDAGGGLRLGGVF
jgi:hypothetical protein